MSTITSHDHRSSTTMPPIKSANPPDSTRIDAPYHFYQNKVLEPYLKQTMHANNLRQFIIYGRQMTPDRLIISANWVRNELLVRLAHRIRDFQQLPFIVGTNPNIEWPYRLYWGGFEALRKIPEIKTKEDNLRFCAFLEDLLEDGQQTLPRMALGVTECAHHYQQQPHDHLLDRFLNRMLRSRISRRLIAEQHVALTRSLYGSPKDKAMIHSLTGKYSKHPQDTSKQVGIFNSECSARVIFEHAQALVTRQPPSPVAANASAVLPDIQLDIHGPDNDITFAYIPEQLEYILYELLNNALYHTMQHHQQEKKTQPDRPIPPIRVTFSCNPTDVFFRISDQGGGIAPPKYDHLWSYQKRAVDGDFDDVQHLPKMPVTMAERIKIQDEQQKRHQTTRPITAKPMVSSLRNTNTITTSSPSALGIGLILARIYSEYWGGELQIISMDGFGTDAYVRIPRLGLSLENIDVASAAVTSNLTHPSIHAAGQQESRGRHHPHHPSSAGRSPPKHQRLTSPSEKQRHVIQHYHQPQLQNKEGWATSSIIVS
ncbi:alpha-ketoacid dehydrogenase kinase [Hesseltinella vesiculosa]|uniref:Protein-serine/threonine kinase n=1 Tax=Hesseltinella vesiculosa TaxID=101127 RepID=A0A1X2GT62_9FUNG|nr:alpha-ketoacid dehydrogenase kinase [Hesseltinella vesiculosa]